MIAKQDKHGVRTASDLERKYNLGQSVTKDYVQSAIGSAMSSSTDEYKTYVDTKVSSVQSTADSAKNTAEAAKADVEALRNDIAVTALNLLVNVEADSLNLDNLTLDKTFAEIEEAILEGRNVRAKLICGGVDHHIYLQMTAHLQGSEIAFFGYFNNLPLVLNIMADE